MNTPTKEIQNFEEKVQVVNKIKEIVAQLEPLVQEAEGLGLYVYLRSDRVQDRSNFTVIATEVIRYNLINKIL